MWTLPGLINGLIGGGGNNNGGSTSRQNVHITAAVNSMVNNIMSCKSNQVILQNFVVSGDNNVISHVQQVQVFKLSTNCANSASNIAKLQQDVAQNLIAAAHSQSEALLGAFNSQGAITDTTIRNEVKQSITNQTITEIINQVNAEQNFIVSGSNNIVTEITQSQTMDLVTKACQDVLNKLDSVERIRAAADNDAGTTQSNPFAEIIDSIFSGLDMMFFFWMIIIIVAIIAGTYFMINGGPLAKLLTEDD